MSDEGNSLTLVLRYEGSLNRSYEKALKQLLQLQSNRPSGPLGSFRNFEPAPATGVDNPADRPGDSSSVSKGPVCGAAPCAATDSNENQPLAFATKACPTVFLTTQLDPTRAPPSRSL